MFCYQCEQTSKGEGCTKIGVCGKQPDVAALQDLLLYSLQGLSLYAAEGRKVGVNEKDVNIFTSKAIFSTLTNVDFDPDRFVSLINQGDQLKDSLAEKVKAAGGKSRLDVAVPEVAVLFDGPLRPPGVGDKKLPRFANCHRRWIAAQGGSGVFALL